MIERSHGRIISLSFTLFIIVQVVRFDVTRFHVSPSSLILFYDGELGILRFVNVQEDFHPTYFAQPKT